MTPVLRDRADLLAAKAVTGYDPARGASLQTHVSNALRELQRTAPEITDPLPAPERLRRKRAEAFAALARLRDDLRRDPTEEEIADELNISPAEFRKLRPHLRYQQPLSMAETGDDETEKDVAVAERTPYDDWIEAVYHDLPPQDRLILQHTTGLNGAQKLSLPQLVTATGLSLDQVRSRVAKLQRRLNEFHG